MRMSTVNELAASLARLEEWARHSESLAKKAEEDRAEMMRQLYQVSATQKKLVDDMEEVKPVTDMVQSLRAKATGAMLVLGMIGTVAIAAFSYFKEAIIKVLWG